MFSLKYLLHCSEILFSSIIIYCMFYLYKNPFANVVILHHIIKCIYTIYCYNHNSDDSNSITIVGILLSRRKMETSKRITYFMSGEIMELKKTPKKPTSSDLHVLVSPFMNPDLHTRHAIGTYFFLTLLKMFERTTRGYTFKHRRLFQRNIWPCLSP